MRRPVILAALSVVATATLVVGSASAANAVAIVRSDNITSATTNYSPGSYSIGQVFTAQADGTLEGVGIFASGEFNAYAGATIEDVTGNLPNGGRRKYADNGGLEFGNPGMTERWVYFSGFTVEAGHRYAVVFNGNRTNMSFRSTTDDVYTGGNALRSTDANGVDLVEAATGVDLQFRTQINSATATSATISGTPPTAMAIGDSLNFQFTVGGNPSPTVTFTGTLPPGLGLSSTGTLSGAATTAGNYTFTVKADNGSPNPPSVQRTIVVRGTLPDPPTNVVAAAGDNQATVTYTPPAWPGTSPISSYTVTASPGGNHCTASAAGCTVTGLAAATSYSFSVIANNGSGASAVATSNSVVVYGKPGAPTSFVAARDGSSVVLSWGVADARGSTVTSYLPEYKPSSSSSWLPAPTPVGNTSTVAGLVVGTVYDFRVTATNAAGAGAAATTSLIPAVLPDATSITSAVASDSTATIDFDPPADTGGLAVDSFDIEVTPAGGSAMPIVNRSSGPYALGGLTNGTDYGFRVRAVTEVGAGPWSAAVTVRPFTRPSAPTTVQSLRGDGEVEVSWGAAASNGSDVTGYSIDFRLATDSGWISAGTTTGLTTVVEGLTNGQLYDFRVRATNAAGDGPYGSTNATPGDQPSAPRDLDVANSPTGVTISWTAPADDGGFAIDDYELQFTENGSPWAAFDTVEGLSVLASDLELGSDYEFRVRANSEFGSGDWSPVVAITRYTAADSPDPVTPTRGDREVELAWAAPAANGSAITGYTVSYRRATDAAWTSLTPTTATSATVTGLTNGVSYQFTVSATNAAGPSVESNIVSAVPAKAATAPVITAEAPSDGGASISYDPPADAGGYPVDGYEVEYREVGATTWESNGSTASVSGLDNGVAVEFRIRAITEFGPGAWAYSAAITPAGLPFAPGLPGAASGDDQVVVTWGAAGGNGSSIDEYQVRYSVVGGSDPVTIDSGLVLTTTVTGLVNGTSYQFEVRAHSATGWSAWSAVAYATPGAVPSAPTTLAVTGGNGALALSWALPSDIGGHTPDDYAVEYRVTGATDWIAAPGVAALAATIIGLDNSVAYDVRVRAHNLVGYGEWATASGTPFVFAPRFTDAAGNPLDGTTLEPGTTIVIEGENAVPGQTLEAVMHSTPVTLGTSTVAPDGSFSFAVTIPATAPAGEHRLVLSMAGVESEISFTVVRAGLAITGLDVRGPLALAALLLALGIGLLVRRRRGHATAR